MAEAATGEAIPTNTAQNPVKLNPILFNEEALSRLLEQHLTGAEAIDKPQGTEAEKPKETEVIQDTEEKPDVAEANAEAEAPSQSEEEEVKAEETVTEEEHSGVQKRIDKLTAQRKEAQEKAETLERELETAKAKLQELESSPSAPATSRNSPLGDIWEFNKLNQVFEEARTVKRWCEDNLEGVVLQDGRELSAKEVKDIKRKAEDNIEIHIPQRVQYLQHFSKAKQEAEVMFPFWKDRTSQDYLEAQQALKIIPEIRNHPEYQKFIGYALVGKKAFEEKQLAKKKPSVASIKKAPDQPAQTKSVPSRTTSKEESLSSAKKNFYQTGTEAALAKILENF